MIRALPAVLVGCVSATGGERVPFAAEVVPVAEPVDGALTWTDATTGTSVTLTTARVWVGPIYLWSDEPLLQVGRTGSPWRPLADALLAPAWAGTDHFEAGFVTGEVTDQVEVDLLAGSVVPLADGVALAGPSRSGEIWLEPARAGHTITLAGEAALTDGAEVPFRLDLTFDGDWFDVEAGENPLLQRRIRGLPWDARLRRGGTLGIEVDVRRWLDDADYSGLRDVPPADGAHPILPGTPLGDLVRQRTRQVGGDRAWEMTWTD